MAKELNYIKSAEVDLTTTTPMMRQFLELKKANQDVILLYRLGDFYETFFEHKRYGKCQVTEQYTNEFDKGIMEKQRKNEQRRTS